MTKTRPELLSLKIIIIGDGAVGKSSVLFTYIKKGFDPQYVPTIMDNYQTTVKVFGNKRICLDIWDTAGQEEFVHIRQLSYPGSDVIMACYSTVSRSSLDNIEVMWIPEIRSHTTEAELVLIGTKSDLMDKHRKVAVSNEEAVDMCKKINAYGTIQCSALLYNTDRARSKIDQAFKLAISSGIRKLRLGRGCCNLL